MKKEHLNLNNDTPVIRHGATVGFNKLDGMGSVVDKITEWIKAGYNTIAVICKTEQEAEKMQNELQKSGINANHLCSTNSQYGNGVITLSVETAKGLEFDCTIVSDAYKNNYDVNSDVDMHLLYVALTRALHEEYITYSGEIAEPLKKELNITRTRQQ